MCGENVQTQLIVSSMSGSPPRVRGKRRCHSERHCDSGITPACAGKTPDLKNAELQKQDHPRVCGENA